MQATVSTKRFGFGRFGNSLAAVGIAAVFAAGIVTGLAVQSVDDDTASSADSTAAVVQPQAYYSASQGEGLVAGNGAVSAALTAHAVGGMGEGWSAGNAALSVLPMAHSSLGQGEGILGGNAGRDALSAPVVAHDAAGMGEGWLTRGRQQSTPRTYLTDGKSEGLDH